MAIIMLVASVFTFGFAGIIFAFIYNRLYIQNLLKQGFEVQNYSGDKTLIERKAQIQLN